MDLLGPTSYLLREYQGQLEDQHHHSGLAVSFQDFQGRWQHFLSHFTIHAPPTPKILYAAPKMLRFVGAWMHFTLGVTLLLDRRSIDLSGAWEKEGHFHYKNFLRASKWGITCHTCSSIPKSLYCGLGLIPILSMIIYWFNFPPLTFSIHTNQNTRFSSRPSSAFCWSKMFEKKVCWFEPPGENQQAFFSNIKLYKKEDESDFEKRVFWWVIDRKNVNGGKFN